jgi:hypothetical protein
MTAQPHPRRAGGRKPLFAAAALFAAASLAGTLLAAGSLELWLSAQPVVDLRL